MQISNMVFPSKQVRITGETRGRTYECSHLQCVSVPVCNPSLAEPMSQFNASHCNLAESGFGSLVADISHLFPTDSHHLCLFKQVLV